MKILSLIGLVLCLPLGAWSQIITMDSLQRISMAGSDELNPAWSTDSRLLAFQSNKNDKSTIYIYDLIHDSLYQLATKNLNVSYPAFIPKNKEVAYALETDNGPLLFKTDLQTKQSQKLFEREILATAPSFSPSGRLVVFKGYDHNTESWQVYSYDFIYDNLNRLTAYPHHEIFRPQFSPDGKSILFGLKNKHYPYEEALVEINWYGEPQYVVDSISAHDFCWLTNGFRIICSETSALSYNKLISIRKDGSIPTIVTDDHFKKATPAISPDGNKMAVAVRFKDDYDLVIFKLQ